MPRKKFLLIKSVGHGFWHEMHNVLAQLLAAELTGRIPVIYWGRNCLYGASDGGNAFERFFMPVSEYKADDLDKNPDDFEGNENVLVLGRCPGIEEIARVAGGNSPYGRMGRRDLNAAMLKKHIRLKDEIAGMVDSFYERNMKGSGFIAVHVRGSDKIAEVRHLNELNGRYPAEINNIARNNPSARIFLMTDCSDILSEYRQMYGDIVVNTECCRTLRNQSGPHYGNHPDNGLKGIEIIMDTWLAAKCDYFVGNGHSNVSMAVGEIKDWDEGRIKLLY